MGAGPWKFESSRPHHVLSNLGTGPLALARATTPWARASVSPSILIIPPTRTAFPLHGRSLQPDEWVQRAWAQGVILRGFDVVAANDTAIGQLINAVCDGDPSRLCSAKQEDIADLRSMVLINGVTGVEFILCRARKALQNHECSNEYL